MATDRNAAANTLALRPAIAKIADIPFKAFASRVHVGVSTQIIQVPPPFLGQMRGNSPVVIDFASTFKNALFSQVFFNICWGRIALRRNIN
jgi:hypothetical protein